MGNAHPNYRGLFVNKSGSTGSSIGILRPLYLTYTVPDQPPASMGAPVYGADFGSPAPTYCTASGDPIYPNSCASEAALVAGFVDWYKQRYNPALVQYAVEGGYFSPFSEASGQGNPPVGQPPRGQLRHNHDNNTALQKKVTVTIYKEDGSIRYGHGGSVRILKFTSYTCPAGFVAKSGAHPSYNPNATNLLSEPTCIATIADQTISTRLRQSSCPTNAEGINPCYPATGDKARFETDFEFAGRPFTRSYHSLRQLGQLPELAPGWVHSYSDRISGNPNYMSEPLLWISDTGYLEIFKRVGSTNHYASEGNADKVLDVESTNTLPHKFILTDQGTLVRYFNLAGRLIRIEDRNFAWKIEFTYNGNRLVAATDRVGNQLLFDYQGNRLIAIHLPDGNAVSYGYDTSRNLLSVQYPDAATKTYHYNEAGFSDANDPHALTGITDNGQRFATYAYDNKGRVRLSQFHTATGPVEKTELAYTGDSQVAVTGRNGEIRNYTLSSTSGYRRVTSVAAANGTSSSSYTGAVVFESRDKLQNVTRYEYATDASYATARYDAYGTPEERKTVTLRDPSYRISTIQTQAKSGANYVTKQYQSFTYNSRSQALTTTMTDPATSTSRTTATAYCEASDAGTCPFVGLVKSVDGARTDVADTTTFTYRMADDPGCATGPSTCLYRKGQMWKTTNPIGQVSEISAYNMYGKPLSVKDANGVTTAFEYTARGWMTARKVRGANDSVETDDQITRIEYWPTGLVKKVTQPDGAFTSYTYDGAQRLTGIADSEGNSITYTLNAASERTKEETKDDQGALMRTLSRTYNTLGQLQTATDAYNRNTGFTYDSNSNLDTTTDALTHVTDNNYDPLDRLKRTLQDMNGIAAETQFKYDVLDNLTQVKDPKGLNTDYTYNGLSDLLQLSSPDTGTTTYTYDSAGNRASQTDARGVTTTYGYDVLNRLTSVAYPTTSLNSSYTYDIAQAACQSGETFSVGRLTKIEDGSGNTVYCYDRFGNLVRKVQTTNVKVFTLRYLFNVAGQLTGMVYPDGAVVDYVRDAHGHVTEVGAQSVGGTRQVVLTNATYYPFGPVAEWTYGNNRVMKRSLNQNYQPGFVEVIGAGGLNIGYEFDEVGNLKKLRTANQVDPPLRVFGYDGLNRLTENKDGTTNAVLEGYTYDKTGNRTSATVGAATTAYGYLSGSHRLDSVGTTARAYDSVGNTTQIGGSAKEFIYNDLNRMSQYRESGLAKMSYIYNGRGEQVRKYASGTTNEYSLYDELGQWLGEYDDSGAPVQQIVWLDNLPVGVLAGASTSQKLYYVEADALGSPRVVVDPVRGASGTAVWAWNLTGEAFGNTAPNQDPDGDSTQFVFDMRFPGQRFDAVSGLNYNYFRDYDPSTGRYNEPDPIGLIGGVSLYGYVGGNPLKAIDPYGLSERDVARITEGFYRIVDQMTRDGQRNSSPWFNNWCRKYPWSPGCPNPNDYKDCGEQTDKVNSDLEKGKYDDSWYFLPDSGIGHTWGVATSSNPNDPVIYYDSRSRQVSVGQPCSSCTGWLGSGSQVYGPNSPPPHPRPPRPR